jgi:hypothetical protein
MALLTTQYQNVPGETLWPYFRWLTPPITGLLGFALSLRLVKRPLQAALGAVGVALAAIYATLCIVVILYLADPANPERPFTFGDLLLGMALNPPFFLFAGALMFGWPFLPLAALGGVLVSLIVRPAAGSFDRLDSPGNRLVLANGREVTFDHPIAKVVSVGDKVIVLLSVPLTALDNENVCGLSRTGEFLWQIEPRSAPGDNDPYVNLYASRGTVRLVSWSGFTREVDPATGTIVSERFTG